MNVRNNNNNNNNNNNVAIPGDRKVMKKEAEKILKHKDLIVEIQRMNAEVIPVKIGPPGTISKSPRQYLSNISGKHEIKRLQKKKTVVLGPAHILQKVLM
jgi:hypothetical protein